MGTRSITVIKNVCTLYRHFDGYLEGHGKELAEFLKDITVTNGIGRETTNVANGINCLAGQIIAHFKKEPGGFYVYPEGVFDVGEEYIYTVNVNDKNKIIMSIKDIYNNITLEGSPQEILDFIKS